MKALNFITNETNHRRYAQIDLNGISQMDAEEIEDLVDILIAEARKDESSESWEDVKNELAKEGKIDVPGHPKALSKKRIKKITH